MPLDFPLLVRSRKKEKFCLGGGKGAVFLLCFSPFPEKGILDLHSIPSNYSSFYGILTLDVTRSQAQRVAQRLNLIAPLEPQ